MKVEDSTIYKWEQFIFILFLLTGLYLTSLYNYLLFHSLAEMFSIIVACGIFMVAWNSRRFMDNNYLLFVGIAYLFIALLDLLHTLAYSGMPIFHGYGANLPTQLWINARYMESLSLLLAPTFLLRQMKYRIVFFIYFVVFSLVIVSVFQGFFPACFIEGTGLTPFKKISEYIISLILLCAIIKLYKIRREFDRDILILLIVSIFFTILGELAFTFYVSAYGISNLVGHYLKIASFFLIYKALISAGLKRPYDFLFRNLKKNEEQLQLEHNRLMGILNTIPNGVYIVSKQCDIEYINPVVKREFGPVDGRKCYEYLNNRSEICPWCKNTEVFAGKSVQWEWYSFKNDRHYELFDTPFLNADGSVSKFEIFYDITERKLAELKRKESSDRFQKVFNSQLDAIFILDSKVPPKIVESNKSASKIFGYETEKMKGRTTEMLHVDEQHLKQFQTMLQTSLKKERYMQDIEFKMKRQNGSIFPSKHAVLELSNEFGERTGWVSVVSDITERKKMEERLRQAQKMESIGNLAGGIAHDFNNLLFPIIGRSEMLLEDLPENSPEYENANEIFNAGKRAGDLVTQILAFSRQSEHKKTPVSVQNVLEEVLKLSRSTIPANIEVQQNIQQDCGIVMADPTQIHQITMNLITNASYAVYDKNGVIDIELKELTLKDNELPDSVLQPGQYVRLSVSDDGLGMSQNVMNNIFDPYFTTKEKGKGTGLGLAVVYGIVKEHGGEIKVYSEVGKGTTFNIYLPLMKNASEVATRENVTRTETGTESILFVDDEVSVAKLVGQMLSRLGYQVTIETDSENALNTFRSNPDFFDIVISDMTMPNITGDQLAKEILLIKPDTPIIICTGFSERINKEQSEALGVKGFLMKPAIKSNMAQMVRKVLDDAKIS